MTYNSNAQNLNRQYLWFGSERRTTDRDKFIGQEKLILLHYLKDIKFLQKKPRLVRCEVVDHFVQSSVVLNLFLF